MAELQVNTPSADAVAKAAAEHTVTDSRGRVFKLKKPGVLSQFRLVEALGDTAKNEVYMAMVLPLIYVSAIDDELVFAPISKMQVEAFINRLDEDGINAVSIGVHEHFGKPNPEADKAALKK